MSVDLNCCNLVLEIRRGDTFRMSFLALDNDKVVDLTGYTITAWASTPGGRCLGVVEVVDIIPEEGTFDLICNDTTEWVTDMIKVVIKFVSPDGLIDSTESIKIAVIKGGCTA